MRERVVVVTRKGQVTIPVEIRKSLGIKEGDRVAFLFDKDEVRIVRAVSVIERTKGMFKTHEPPLSARELREAAADAIADGAIERSGL